MDRFLHLPGLYIKVQIKSFGKVQETLSRKGFLVVEDKLGGGFWLTEPSVMVFTKRWAD